MKNNNNRCSTCGHIQSKHQNHYLDCKVKGCKCKKFKEMKKKDETN